MQAQTTVICDQCGAPIPAAPGRTILTCPYCGAAKSLVPATGPSLGDFEFLVPTTAEGPRLRSLVRQILVESRDAPDDVLDAGRFVEEGFIFAPMWKGRGSFRSHWSASFGFNRQESYTDFVTRTDSRGRPFQERVTRSRTVTDWRPASGDSSGRFSTLVFAGDPADPLSPPPAAARGLETATPAESAVGFNPAILGGLEAMAPAMDKRRAEDVIRRRVEEGPAVAAAFDHAKGDVQRDWAVDTEVYFEGPLQLGLIPVAKAVFEYKGALHAFWFEGAAFSARWYGSTPSDPTRGRRKFRSWLPLLAGLVVCAASAGWILYSGRDLRPNPVPLLLALVPALVFGAARSGAIERHSRAVRKASLARAKLAEADSHGTPLTDVERRALQDECRIVKRPWLAETAHDARRILVGVVLVGLLALFGFNDGPWSVLARARDRFGPSAAVESPETAPPAGSRGAESRPGGSAGPAPSAGRSAPQAGLRSRDAAPAPRPRPSEPAAEARPEPDRRGGAPDSDDPFARAPVDLASLDCSGPACLDRRGRPVTGLVYESGPRGGWPISAMAVYRRGVQDGTAVFFGDDMSIDQVQSFRGGVPEGLLARLHPSSGGGRPAVSEVVRLEAGKYHGPAYGWDAGGRLTNVGGFVEDLEDGAWYEFHPDGSVKSVAVFDRGRRVSRRSYGRGEVTQGPSALVDRAALDAMLDEARRIREAALDMKP